MRCSSRWAASVADGAGCSEHNLARYAVHPGETAGSSRVPLFSEDGIRVEVDHDINISPPSISGLAWPGMLSVLVWSITARTPFSLSGAGLTGNRIIASISAPEFLAGPSPINSKGYSSFPTSLAKKFSICRELPMTAE
ncbi:hypothetical protein TIFTF001_040990 [Ficus carica]|uniref:Uncharacterized protein n=1 Tax=Ficus carica TaxID=3494 RepID=A0AA88CRY7_FICCA|nr:hypothetical protein TIFTF001_040979 [Ficus carica]GMN27178.1 hypothetical protein TIFTF001_040990 [Ficus carica]